MKIYVASSWRNELQPSIVTQLRDAGHLVYDFRNPGPGEHGFSWSEIDPDWKNWTAAQFRDALKHPTAVRGLGLDFAGMQWADATVMVQPCGRSAALELGWAIGAKKRTVILLAEKQEPELMFALADSMCLTMDEVIADLSNERLRLASDKAIEASEIDIIAKAAFKSDLELIALMARIRNSPSRVDQEAIAQVAMWQIGELMHAVKALQIAEAALTRESPEVTAAALTVVRGALEWARM